MYIASLTTYKTNTYKTHLCIQSLLNQTRMFDKIVLNIHVDDKKYVGKELLQLERDNKTFEINYVDTNIYI